jgi:gamma-glutamylcysteine synthetase
LDLRDYVVRICDLRPIYVKRNGRPIVLCDHYERFCDYFSEARARGRTVDGDACVLSPAADDIATHNSCYWYTARISQYFTVENRVFDQQPRDALLAPAALTLGLAGAAAEAWEEVSGYPWEALRATREHACRHGMGWRAHRISAGDLAQRMLELAALGLRRRGRGEEAFLAPLYERLRTRSCPADDAVAQPGPGWPAALLEARAL